jgi:very-short-patch-repair endonuclease
VSRSPSRGAPGNGAGDSPDPRLAAVRASAESWINKLIDLSRRNNLLFFRDLKTGTLDLSGASPEVMDDLFNGKSVPISRLLGSGDGTRASAQLRSIWDRAVLNREEKGLETLFMARGMATWRPTDGGRPPEAPLVLLPLSMHFEARATTDVVLSRAGDLQVNPILCHALRQEFGVVLDPEELLTAGDDEDNLQVPMQEVSEKLHFACSTVPDFAISGRAVIGNFSFQKMAMVKDLRDSGDRLAESVVVSAVAGVASARSSIGAAAHSPNPRDFDSVPAENEFLVLDADASQQAVVAAALMGQTGVIHGPPGTGKSQTIANLIGECSARGKRVLFVAEKRAALEVVLDRLTRLGLAHLALDLHGADVSRREVMEHISDSLQTTLNALPPDTGIHSAFESARVRLTGHVERLHAKRAPSGKSVFQLQGELLRLPETAKTTLRFRGARLEALSSDKARRAEELLTELMAFEDLLTGASPSAWLKATRQDAVSLQGCVDQARSLASEALPTLRELLTRAATEGGIVAPATLTGCSDYVGILERLTEIGSRYKAGILNQNVALLARDLEPGRKVWSRIWHFITDSDYKNARRRLLEARFTQVSTTALLNELDELQALALRYRALTASSAPPRIPSILRSLSESLERAGKGLAGVQVVLPSAPADDLAEIAAFCERALSEAPVAMRIPRMNEVVSELEALGLLTLIEELRRSGRPAASWTLVFRMAWLTSCLEKAQMGDPALAGFDGRVHDKFSSDFRRLDKERIGVAIARVKRAHAERLVAKMNEFPQQAALIQHEGAKKRQIMPLRKLFEQAPDVLTALHPCWMASPLSVSQLLPPGEHFDLVLFDEASQVLPYDAISALMRAKHAVVAGDRHQLPPTTFFAAAEEDEEEVGNAIGTEGFESLLDVFHAFAPAWPLDWHYRSRDESLIAFSNRHIYQDRLVTFPSSQRDPSVNHVQVPWEPGKDGQEESAATEVEQVVDLILNHAETRPAETLGVITMGIKHMRRVEAKLEAARRTRPELDGFFSPERKERFFVKNLERVQGDERDAIILSVGSGRNASGEPSYRFGPLLYEGGERRLNVAVTRARNTMTIVSSFGHVDMDPKRSSSKGVELLRLYLEYAASGGKLLGQTAQEVVPPNPFELDVLETLESRGLKLIPQWGASRCRIDMVVCHPKEPGRFVLAIECDGASYHSAPTARDRDRLRQQHLEALGWRFCRIWSTDWFTRKDAEVQRVLKVYEESLATPAPPSRRASAERPALTAVRPVAPRPPKPVVSSGRKIHEFNVGELIAIVRWIKSDGLLRTGTCQ